MQTTYRFFIAILCGSLLAAQGWAQTCQQDTIKESTPTARFTFDKNGTVTDTETGITWLRCALGQQWNGTTCTGSANTYDWQAAMNAVQELNKRKFGGHDDWRLPFIPELASIAERQCFNPRVNLAVFPGTPTITFWSGMERMGYPDMAYALDFGNGDAHPEKKIFKGAVRPMHDGPNGPWWKMPEMPKMH